MPYCIFIDTICGGMTPVERDADGGWVIYNSKAAALREITDDYLERQRQFFEGEREFEDAMEIEEVICKVECLENGSVIDEAGRVFPPNCD